MSARDVLDQACRALLAYRLRAALSAIGIVFGIATVVTAMAIGQGARREALAEIGSLGLDNIFVRAVRPARVENRRPAAAPDLTIADASAIRHRVREAAEVAAIRSTRSEVAAGSRRATAAVLGVTPSWASITGLRVARGRWLTAGDERASARVALLAPQLADALFPGTDPIGRDVRVSGTWYRIVGTLEGNGVRTRPASTIQRHDMSAVLLMPRAAMDLSLGGGDRIDRVDEIAIRTRGADHVAHAAASVERVLRTRASDRQGHELVVPRELLRARLKAQRTFTVVLFAISGLALVISGIGIMNIMLASVAERTTEIGVRRAFGAKRRDIAAQFALEATLLCAVGGLAGLPLGGALSAGVAMAAGWPVAISLPSAGLALMVAGVVGLCCGIYPARLAARLEPAVAVKAE